MPLQSKLFTLPPSNRLNDCLERDSAHITPGSTGDHVKRIQTALTLLSMGPNRPSVFLKPDGIYGPKTAAAVKAYKNQRRIFQSWQNTADDIVGKGTIKSLDDEMSIYEEEVPVEDKYVSTSILGFPTHDHNLCTSKLDYENDGTFHVSHVGTPINPLPGTKICVGGTNEVGYLGFKDYVPDPDDDPSMPSYMVHSRPYTWKIPSHSVTNIAFRSTPLDEYMKHECKRLAIRGCRLTFAGDPVKDTDNLAYFRSLGPVLEHGVIFYDSDITGRPYIVVSMVNHSIPYINPLSKHRQG